MCYFVCAFSLLKKTVSPPPIMLKKESNIWSSINLKIPILIKTFTVALAIEKNLVSPLKIIKNIPRKIKCSVHEISDIKTFPNSMTVEDIVIQSSNIGTIKIAQQIGVEKYKNFF